MEAVKAGGVRVGREKYAIVQLIVPLQTAAVLGRVVMFPSGEVYIGRCVFAMETDNGAYDCALLQIKDFKDVLLSILQMIISDLTICIRILLHPVSKK